MPESTVEVDWAKKYPHLDGAPIVEAVIHWQARAERPWISDELRVQLAQRLPDYPKISSHQGVLLGPEASSGEQATPPTASQQMGWLGFRLASANGLQIAQFNHDGLAFSRLRPYQSWHSFAAEGRRLWRVFVELAAPSQIHRLGVRFINRITIRAVEGLGEYLNDPPTRPVSLPLSGFLYVSTFDLPDFGFGISVAKTLQVSPPGANASAALIIDIDVFTKRPMPCNEALLDERLPRMRHLKNAVFFNLLTEDAIAHFQGRQDQ